MQVFMFRQSMGGGGGYYVFTVCPDVLMSSTNSGFFFFLHKYRTDLDEIVGQVITNGLV